MLNVGSGESVTVDQVAARLARQLGKDDIPRRSPASTAWATSATASPTSPARAELIGYRPQVALDDGMAELAAWLEGQAADDRVEQARQELSRRGLTV